VTAAGAPGPTAGGGGAATPEPAAGGASAGRAPVLELHQVRKHYGLLKAVDGVSLSVRAGGRQAIIGPNGAGKSTLLDLVSGTTRVSGGRVLFRGTDVTGLAEHRRARLGIAKTFQRSNLFDGLTAVDNVVVAVQRRDGVARRWLRPAGRFTRVDAQAVELLDLVGLAGRARVEAGQLSHGERRQLEMAIALAGDPSLLLLDEPTAGMSRGESDQFVGLLAALPASLAVLLIEHDLDVVFAVAASITVLAAGSVIAEGPPAEIRASPEVQQAYLGAHRAADLFERG
jgi:branched-chain amino acid transport system ATP-binding protein